MQLVIYQITNKINGKSYIGKTSRYEKRIKEHCRNGGRYTSVVNQAIRKYGKDSFIFEILKVANNDQELSELEGQYIREKQTLFPKGYNLTLSTDHGVTLHEETLRKISITAETHNSTGYKGVCVMSRRGGRGVASIVARFKFRNKKYEKSFATIEEAAEFYDIFMLYRFGEDCVVNFPDKICKYKKNKHYLEMETFINASKKTSSKFRGVSWDKRIKKWRTVLYYNNKQIFMGVFIYENAAALISDIGNLFYDTGRKLNFPDLSTKISQDKINYLYSKYRYYSKSRYKGISYVSKKNMWRVNILNPTGGYVYIGHFPSIQGALYARNNAIKQQANPELYQTWNDLLPP